jgi:signal transduction histidine kinase
VQVRRLAEIPAALAANDFDIVLTDLGLPDSVGLETCRAVRRIAPDLPVIVLTGLDDDATGEAALGAGAQDYLVKGQITGSGLGRSVRHAIERHALITRLRHASRTEVVGQLAGAIAHDFNNLLTVILGNTSLLGATTDLEEVAQLATDIEDAAGRAAGLVRQLLTFGRRQVMHKTPIDLNNVLVDFVRVIRRLIPGNIRIEVRLAPDLPMIVADVGMLEQVIPDLTLNARDAMPGGGRLTFVTALVEVAATDAVRFGVRPGRYVRLGVQDSGAGIDRELIETIWEPFYTAMRPGVSSGLGLAAVRSVAQQHQGFADVHVEEGLGPEGEAGARRGATFSVYLPVTGAPPTLATLPQRGRTGASGRVVLALVPDTRVLLVVDDDDTRREETADALANAGYEIHDARGGTEARVVVARERIDLALVVAGRRGVRAAVELRDALLEARRGIEVLLAAPDPTLLAQAELPAETRRGFVVGPWSADQLVAAIAARLMPVRPRA